MTPKGKLFIIGGHEDKGFTGETPEVLGREKPPTRFEILGALISSATRAEHKIEIIAAASGIPAEMEEMYVTAYKNAGCTDVSVMRIERAEHAHSEDYVQRIEAAHCVFFTGGDQKRLTKLLAGTPVLEAIKKNYQDDEDFIIAGTSAGAMAMPATIIARGIIEEALLKSDLEMCDGLGIIDGILVDTHFIKRGRFGRLAHAVAHVTPRCVGGYRPGRGRRADNNRRQRSHMHRLRHGDSNRRH